MQISKAFIGYLWGWFFGALLAVSTTLGATVSPDWYIGALVGFFGSILWAGFMWMWDDYAI